MNSKRVNAARALITENQLDGLLISNILNIGYVTGFTGTTALVLITKEENLFLTDFRYTSQARQQAPDFEIVDISKPEALKSVFADRPGLRRLGYESTDVTVARLQGWSKQTEHVQWVAIAGAVSDLRMIKDDDEIALIRHAITIAQESFLLVSPLLQPGTTETEFAIELEFAMRRAGAAAPAFDTIVASGENGAYPHYRPGDRAFEAGDFVTIDWGAKYGGYCSDITRTVVIAGSPSPKQREIYDIVENAMLLAIDSIAPGKTGKEIDAIARDFIASRGYGEYFGHSLGHSLGKDVHDGNTLSQRGEEVVLKPGFVTTVEPGIYIDGFGGVRIEEDVLVTETGHLVLTKAAGPLI